eukprot:TRINITY_DN17674_c0_g1_i1.p1 TRINITY_DN17674_c0_g1~~TRINITY_DN17674_c0_g1_i1.p1  ORF type:complete len:236 (-),score=36.22 TRINITY_DN17674_c0_g1_i1:33-740(-)
MQQLVNPLPVIVEHQDFLKSKYPEFMKAIQYNGSDYTLRFAQQLETINLSFQKDPRNVTGNSWEDFLKQTLPPYNPVELSSILAKELRQNRHVPYPPKDERVLPLTVAFRLEEKQLGLIRFFLMTGVVKTQKKGGISSELNLHILTLPVAVLQGSNESSVSTMTMTTRMEQPTVVGESISSYQKHMKRVEELSSMMQFKLEQIQKKKEELVILENEFKILTEERSRTQALMNQSF